MTPLQSFLAAARQHNIKPTIVGRSIVSACVSDTPALRHAAVEAAQELFVAMDSRERADNPIRRLANKLNAALRAETMADAERAAVDREDGVQADAFFCPGSDFEFDLWVSALTENSIWREPPAELNNTLVLTRADIGCTLGDLFRKIMARENRIGAPRLSYVDSHDQFEIRLTHSNLGYEASVTLNNRPAYQLNSRKFTGNTPIGRVMAIAAGAPMADVEAFFS